MDEVIFFSHSAHQHGAINDWLKVSPNRYRIKKKSKKKKILKCFWVISHYQAFFFFFQIYELSSTTWKRARPSLTGRARKLSI